MLTSSFKDGASNSLAPCRMKAKRYIGPGGTRCRSIPFNMGCRPMGKGARLDGNFAQEKEHGCPAVRLLRSGLMISLHRACLSYRWALRAAYWRGRDGWSSVGVGAAVEAVTSSSRLLEKCQGLTRCGTRGRNPPLACSRRNKRFLACECARQRGGGVGVGERGLRHRAMFLKPGYRG